MLYNVSFASFDVGQVRIQLLDTLQRDDRIIYKAVASIDSYKGVPFVNLHAVYESWIDQDIYSSWFHSRKKEDNFWKEFIYNFDYSQNALYINHPVEGIDRVDQRDTLQLDTLYQDGLSLFYFAREHVLSKGTMQIPTVVSEVKSLTQINFSVEKRGEEIEAVKYPINTVYFNGEAGFVGIFGLTGAFEGWFSNDEARVPILAKMKVIIGNIRIELMNWNRPGWEPPQHYEE